MSRLLLRQINNKTQGIAEMILSLPLERSVFVPAVTQASDLASPLTHPAINMETESLCDAAEAYVQGAPSERAKEAAKLRPDRAMRSVAEFLAAPKSAPAASQAEDLKSFTVCPLMHDTYDNPVVAADGFTYSLSAIKGWWKTQADSKHALTSPMTREEITDFRLVPSAAMRAMMTELGITDCHSPAPSTDDVAQWAHTLSFDDSVSPTRRHLQLDYLRDAPAVLAHSDHRIGGLADTLRASQQPLSQLRVALVGLRAQAQVKTLFSAPQFSHIHEVAKTFRAVDVQLQLGHVKKAETLLAKALVKAPDNPILLSRLALIEARRGHDEAATQALAKLFACPADEVMSQLSEHTFNNPARLHRSVWPLLAAHGFLLEDTDETQEARALLHAAADLFPSRLLNSYRAEV